MLPTSDIMPAMQYKKLLPILFFFPLFPVHAQPRVIWKIGEFNESPVEFAKGLPDSVSFQVGTSNAEKDWPARQRTGSTYQILFPLNTLDRSYVLKIATLIDRPRVPALEISVNGHGGRILSSSKA